MKKVRAQKLTTAAAVKSAASNGIKAQHSVQKNLELRVKGANDADWLFRVTIDGKLKQRKLGAFGAGVGKLSYSEATAYASELRLKVSRGENPFEVAKTVDKVDSDDTSKVTLNECARRYLESHRRQSKSAEKDFRVYLKYVEPTLGNKSVTELTSSELHSVCESVFDKIGNDKSQVPLKLFNYLSNVLDDAIIRGDLKSNPALPLSKKRLRSPHIHKDVALSWTEIEHALAIFYRCGRQFTRPNYLLAFLSLCFGTRKMELLQAKWDDFTLVKGCWEFTARLKRKGEKRKMIIDIPEVLNPVIDELKMLSFGSEYVFPALKQSKKGHMCENTANHALNKLFGKQYGKRDKEFPADSEMGRYGFKTHFTIHDLRHTFATLMVEDGEETYNVDRCLGHVQPGQKGNYIHSEYRKQRLNILNKMAEKMMAIKARVESGESAKALGLRQ